MSFTNIDADNISDWFKKAYNLHQQGKKQEAAEIYKHILQVKPDHSDSLHLLGLITHLSGNRDQAIHLISQAIRIIESPVYYTNLGVIYKENGSYSEAIDCFQKAIGLKPDLAEAHANIGNTFLAQKHPEDALPYFQKAIEINPDLIEVHINLGNALSDLCRYEEAIACFRKALTLNPNSDLAYYNIGNALQSLGRFAESIESYQKATALNPNDYKSFYGIGNSLLDMKRTEEAIGYFQKSLKLCPDLSEAYSNIIHLSQQICAWDTIGKLSPRFDELVNQDLASGKRVSETPLVNLSKEMNPERNLAIAKSWSDFIENAVIRLKKNFSFDHRKNKQKITIAYLSNDFCNHPVAHLMLGIFALHDRNRFNVFCYSYGGDDGSYHRQRIISDCDKFIDIRTLSVSEAAERIYRDGVDILIDLMGHTKNCRPQICALRPAPIIVTYLGYPGTTGASFFDYAIADKVVAPKDHARFYSEKLVYMPHCYQANDHNQLLADKIYTRADFNIPEDAFVFCSFNQNYKLEPVMFGAWMRILHQIPGSVLWLLDRGQTALSNLRNEARKRGVDPDRLIFGGKLGKAEHLSRQYLADLILDTRIYTGHTTTSDALWAGVPVITIEGQHFASRVSSSILQAIGLPELITRNLDDFEKLAVKLAKDSESLNKIRQRIAKNRLTEPLFDTPRFVRNLEQSYLKMWELFVSGQSPRQIEVIESEEAQRHKGTKAQSFNIEAALKQGFDLHQAGRISDAAAIYDKVLDKYPSHADALHLRGVAAHQTGDNEKAITLIRQAIRLSPNNAPYYSNLGAAFQVSERHDDAIEAYRKAVEIQPTHIEAWLNLGSVLKATAQYHDAIPCFQKVLEIQPNYPDAYSSMGLVYRSLGKTETAMSCFQKALEIKPNYIEVLNNMGLLLQEQSRLDDAVACFEKVLAIKPDHLSSLNNLGVVLQAQGKNEEAVSVYQRAIAVKPSPEPYLNMGNVYKILGDIDNSIVSYEAALQINADYPEAYGSLFHQLQHACEWTRMQELAEGLDRLNKKLIKSGKKSAEVPFVNLTRSMNLAENFEIAQSWNRAMVESVKSVKCEVLGVKNSSHNTFHLTHNTSKTKLRIAYLSYDFRNHPVAHLMLGVFGLHNRKEFEIIGYYYGKDDDSGYRKRIGEGCDKFIDLTGMSHSQAADRISQDGVDILIDLMGHTENQWLEIFALRPARIQASYLGYPGTTGGEFMDYIITDRIVTPPEHAQFYTEKFVYLPDCYQVTDGNLKIPHRPWKRKHFGLPENAFVFCSFNHSYKIEPKMFDVWMRILTQIPDSVLWFQKKNPRTENNLRKEAEKRGVNAARLIFADRLTYKEEHLTRQAFADLALDTRIYNGHTTTSDALWAGVPVVTLQGGHFASRAASSLLNAIALPELITRSIDEYESLVLKLAKNPDELLKIRQKLAKNRLTEPLFDTPLFVTHLEQAFHKMWKIYAAGEKPSLIAVQSVKCDVLSVRKEDLTLNTLTHNTYGQMGMKLQQEGRFEEAIAAFQKAIEIDPDYADAHGNMGNVYLAQGKSEDAIACYHRVLELKPDSFEAYNNTGNAYLALKRFDAAIAAFQKSIEIKPDLAEAYNNIGTAYKNLDKLEQAFSYYQKAIELKPDFPEAYSNYVPHLQALCYWDQLEKFGSKLDRLTNGNLEKGLKAAETPFESLTRFSDPALNFKVAASWAKHIAMPMKHIQNKFDFEKRSVRCQVSGVKEKDITLNTSHLTHKNKIKIGYLSNDFCNHPVGHLTVSMFGLHHRNTFEVYAYSYGVNDNSYFRRQIEQECDHFVNIREMNHQEAANRIYADGIDILIDLMGYTKDHRLEICAFRPAPIQILWLGYPGTSGADFFDYIITDKIVTPPEHEQYFSEKPILMPYTYLVNNHTQQIAIRNWQRKDFGIPENAFVFCSFNQSYKIEPKMFDVWMRILTQIPESVLWLSSRYPTAAANLKREAEKRRVSADRLIFAEKLALKEEYLARLQFADLALDTRLYNGHATTSDALWAGVPVITLQGGHFASRVASSILTAIGLPELITHSLEEYEGRVLRLYRDSSELQRIRQKLAKNRLTSPLFDTPKFVHFLETALKQTWQLFIAGEKPKRIEFQEAPQTANVHAELETAIRCHQSGQMDAAKQQYEKILELSPKHPDALHLLGVLHHQLGKQDIAIELIRKAIEITPNSFLYYGNLGAAYHALKQYDQALSCYRKSLEIKPDHQEARINIQKVLTAMGQQSPDVRAELHQGLKYQHSGNMKQAAECYQRILSFYPDQPDALQMLGIVEHFFGNDERSLSLIRRAIEINPKNPMYHSNLGNTLRELGRLGDAVAAYRKSIELNSEIPEVHVNMGLIHQDMGKPEDAISYYIRALEIKPDLAEACSYLVSQLKATFQWQKLYEYAPKLDKMTQEALNKGLKPSETPFDILSRNSDPESNFKVARAWSSHVAKMMESVKWQVLSVKNLPHNTSHLTHNTLKIGYLSCDFRNHPVTHLILGLLKRHDRSRFEIFGYAYGGPDPTDWQQKVAQSCDHFTDIHAMTHLQAAQRIAEDGIDILVDLTGHTRNNRLSICALRPAGVQITYLGFPGTSGAEFFDYILTDKVVSPQEHESYYSEKFIYLPNCYIVYDNMQTISGKTYTRAEAGLPESGMVFCSFNQPYKIEPKIFDIWMKILSQVPDSVLWLSERDVSAQKTLRMEAEKRGVREHRLIFASKVHLKEEYLARLSLADLALDTFVYNGHATTADALWAGVPVISVQGNHFASRAASSILRAVGLPELICQSLTDYEALAMQLAKNPDERIRIRQKLAKNRLSSPMFDTQTVVRDIEQAYQTILQMFRAGQSPRHIEITRFDPNAELANAFNHHQAGRLSEAKAGYERILQLYPNHADTIHLYGVIIHQQKDNERAIEWIRKAIALSPQNPMYYNNLGIVLHEMKRFEDAAAQYRKAAELSPDYAEAYHNLGLALKMLGRWDEAFSVFQKAAKINPKYADAYNGMGLIRQNQDKQSEAMEYFQKAVQLNPNYADAYYNMANTLAMDHEKAISCYRRVLELQPDHRKALANLYHRLVYTCSWDDLESLSSQVDDMLEKDLKSGEKTAEQPLMSVIWNADPDRNLAVAKSWSDSVKCHVLSVKNLSHNTSHLTHNTLLKIGYLSNDFRNHPVAHLISGLFRLHDRREFEIFCYSYSPDDGSFYRRKIMNDCDCFADIQHLSHEEAARRIREDGIHILVDMTGYTKGIKMEICAMRPAPIQVNYLGFPGTSGADFFDYIIGDKTVIPPEHARYYTEKIVYMPHSYQVNDHEQAFSDKPMTRADMGLPQNSFVFCAFTQAYKIEPVMFGVWMNILKQVPDSVLWLLPEHHLTESNLRKEAEKRGVDTARLIVAKRFDKSGHLTRHILADMVLDTRIYNGHTTTSDALWAGVPVISSEGTHFASRVAASLLKAVGLPQLVMQSLEEYESTAVRLARNPDELICIRQRLSKNRLTEPLFDTRRFAGDMENAYKEMWKTWLADGI